MVFETAAQVGEIRQNNDKFLMRALDHRNRATMLMPNNQSSMEEDAQHELELAKLDVLMAIHGELRIANLLKAAL